MKLKTIKASFSKNKWHLKQVFSYLTEMHILLIMSVEGTRKRVGTHLCPEALPVVKRGAPASQRLGRALRWIGKL